MEALWTLVSRNRWIRAQKAEREYWLKQKETKNGRTADFWSSFILRHFTELLFCPKVLIEIGCGPAGLVNYMDGEMKIGIDPLADTYKRHFYIPQNVQLIKSVGEKLPLKSGVADLLFCVDVLDHTKSPRENLKEIQRVLSKRGLFILYVKTFPFPLHLKVWNKLRTYGVYHPHHFTAFGVKQMLKSAGLEDLKTIYEKPQVLNSVRGIGFMFPKSLFIMCVNLAVRVGFVFSRSLFTATVKIAARHHQHVKR